MPADSDFELEADYYNRKAMERAYPGEAWNGATKDWAIVDVPPGTNRVRMDGLGGGGQEITWQRYNGVRRSKFTSGDEEYSTDFGAPVHSKPKTKDMWTEITKDLVLKEAIDSYGYDYEETDDFFYVMDYLKYVSFVILSRRTTLTTNRRMFCSWLKSLTTFDANASLVFDKLSTNVRKFAIVVLLLDGKRGTTSTMSPLIVVARGIGRGLTVLPSSCVLTCLKHTYG